MLSTRDLKELLKAKSDNIIGIDLAGSPVRRTGIAFFDEGKLVVRILYEDSEIIETASKFEYAFIDAPLSLPAGRHSIDEKSPYHFRECDIKLRKLGIKFFPVSIGGMRALTKRGMILSNVLQSRGVKTYETLPGALYDRFGIRRKEIESIKGFYSQIFDNFEMRDYHQDELDAVACLITGVLYINGLSTNLDGQDGTIIIA